MAIVEKERIFTAVKQSEQQIVELVERLVSIPTENPPGALYRECVQVISDEMKRVGLDFEVKEIPETVSVSDDEEYPRFAVLARHGIGEPVLHFHGHYDVVPAEDQALFEPENRDGRIHGRGSSDMKSGLAAMIYAIDALKACEIELHGSISLSIVPYEETCGVLGSKYLTEAGHIAQAGIGMLTAEPTSGAIWNASRGAISLLIRVKGVPMHVGLQHDGVNAFDNMVVVANALTELKREVEVRSTAYNIQPAEARHCIMMLGGRCEGGTNFNLVPGECSFTVDRRINPEEDFHTEKQRLFDVLQNLRDQGIDIEVEVIQEGASAGVSEDTPVARALASNVELVTGARPEFEMCPGLLEIRFYAGKGIPAFAYGPGILEVSHGPDEFVPIANVLDCAVIYALTACDVLGV
jgi:succinyl-diaminopimelate desuccinylase